MRKQFLLVLMGFAASQSAAAQQPVINDAGAAIRGAFAEVSANVTKAADLVPAEKFSYKPAPTVRTFAQQIAHIADSHNYYCSRAAGKKNEWSDPVEKGSMDKAVLVQKLKESIDACTAAYASGTMMMPMISNVGHTNLHYGNIITYLRMMGLVPPSS